MTHDWKYEGTHEGTLNGEPCIVVESFQPVFNQATAEVLRYEVCETLHIWDKIGGFAKLDQAADPDRNSARSKLKAKNAGLVVKWKSDGPRQA